MSFDKLKSGNNLFLICPTDHIESVLNRTSGSKAYFYTALGASFSWDIATQQGLTALIENKNIDQVIFVTKYTNLFYKETVATENEYASFRVNQKIIKLEKTLPNYFLKQSHPMLKVMLLASRHLHRQQQCILETSLLGKTLKQNRICLKSFVYHPGNEAFFTPKMIEKKVLLYGKLSPN